MEKTNRTKQLAESAVMVAAATVLSLITVIKMPYGGSVTPFSMLPIIIIAYRYGTVSGLVTGLCYGLIQMILGASNLSYATSFGAAVAIILLDYLIAFGAMGLAGVFKKAVKDPVASITLGTILACFVRYICHVISGCTVWAGVSIPDTDGLVYSLVYNSAYMVPETILTVAGAIWLFSLLDFRKPELTRMVREKNSKAYTALTSISLLSLIAVIVYDAISVFSSIQSEEGFDITLISGANFALMGIISAIGIVVSVVLFIIAKQGYEKK